MRLVLLAILCSFAHAQNPAQSPNQEPDWRRPLMSLPERPAPNTTAREVARFEESVLAAAPYLATLSPDDYEANRDLVRRMTAYMTGLDLLARDTNPQLRQSVGRARRAMAALRVPLPLVTAEAPERPFSSPPQPGGPGPGPGGPPFALRAPVIPNDPASDKAMVKELSRRYDSAAALAAAAWEQTDVLRQNLNARGMALSAQTAASSARLQLYFELAAGALLDRDWEETRIELERAEYETDKILKSVGR